LLAVTAWLRKVREAVGNRERKLIGVVYNAIDDQSTVQISCTCVGRWKTFGCYPRCCTRRAAPARVVLTADMTCLSTGRESGREAAPIDGACRWCAASENQIEGGRVLTPSAVTAVAMPFSERVDTVLRRTATTVVYRLR